MAIEVNPWELELEAPVALLVRVGASLAIVKS